MDKKVFRDISYGMYLVTTKDKEQRNVGCVINTLTQVTSENPMITISLNKNNYTNQAIKWNQKFAISIVSVDTPKEVIGTFGYHSSKEMDKFESVQYEMVENLPVIQEQVCGYVIAEVNQVVDCSTHDIIVGKVIDTKKSNDYLPMSYQYYHEKLKGVSPKNAPTYVDVDVKLEEKGSKYRCTLCGYIYDDEKEEVKFEDLPADWKCPLCGVGKESFEKIAE